MESTDNNFKATTKNIETEEKEVDQSKNIVFIEDDELLEHIWLFYVNTSKTH